MAVVHAEQAEALARSLQQRQASGLPLLTLCAAAPGLLCTCKPPMLDVSHDAETGRHYAAACPAEQAQSPPTACSSIAKVMSTKD